MIRTTSARHTQPQTHQKFYGYARVFEGFVWFILGPMIIVWLLWPSKHLEIALWIGFSIGCTMTGLFTIHHALGFL